MSYSASQFTKDMLDRMTVNPLIPDGWLVIHGETESVAIDLQNRKSIKMDLRIKALTETFKDLGA